MKKTLIALMALAGIACGTETLTLYDQWTFDTNLTSVNGRQFTAQAFSSISYSNGIATLKTGGNRNSGIHLNDDNALGLTNKDWALQVTMQLPSLDGIDNNDVFLNTSNNDTGFKLSVSKTSDEETGDVAVAIKASNGDATTLPFDNSRMVMYTILNYNGNLYFGADEDWCKVVNSLGNEVDYINGTWFTASKLNKLMIGFGDGANNAIMGDYKVADISVYTFDHTTVTVGEVKAALIPEPATATLSLLALAGLAARRRRH